MNNFLERGDGVERVNPTNTLDEQLSWSGLFWVIVTYMYDFTPYYEVL